MPEQKLIDECVHCGFCLPACPTYRSGGQELDSPRGRIYLMKGLANGSPPSEEVLTHFDRCLGCMGCVTACPSGVRYDALIEQTRAELEPTRQRPLLDRIFRAVMFAVLPYPKRLRRLAFFQWIDQRLGLSRLLGKVGLYRVVPQLRPLEALTPPLSRATLAARVPEFTPAAGERRARVAVLLGCVQRVFFPEVNLATVRVLAAEGCDVHAPEDQGCCGALSLHVGRAVQARELAKALIVRLEGLQLDHLVVNSAGCGSAIKEYDRLFADDPEWKERAKVLAQKCLDVTEVLARLGPVAHRHPIPMRAAYHEACHLAHAQKVRAAPRAVLATIPELVLVEVPDGDQCCGSAGVYNLLQPASAREIGLRKVEAVLSTAPQLLIAANPGCTLQITNLAREQGRALKTAHPIELLDASIRGVLP